MNWKLIFQLSLFGLIMAFATVWVIPQNLEWVFWLVIFIFCAYTIAKVCSAKYFFNGFMVSIFNCVWITAVHMIFCVTYLQNHPEMSQSATHLPAALQNHPREIMLIFAPFFGIASGLVLGLFSFISSKIIKKNPMQTV